ncbi:uncharacterized protein FA14DRAFT_162729 [Meira miltonrushii]|uniref:GIT Spa2 homology (SHD) domain-containing protein n=1 Tax=Meira miltonrushii TaxID=1280837 RepID=A0A316V1R0_9BASI|nr:uncharacterized protein FA14DRAFT_162729 [Meira miltonrushii]PWN31476.1 hypothetical protein FA14DRAFT_162729 [Meira miltonrushii]
MDSTQFAHQRGASSLSSSSSGGGRRYNISHPTDQPQTLVSPPFQPFGQTGYQNGTMATGYPGYPNGQPSANHNQAYSSGSNGHRTGGSIANANGMVSNGVHHNEPPSTRVRHKRPDTEEIKRVAHIHYEELFKFLKSHLAKGQRGPRTNAREKLTRLSQQQFTELSTDVYDELMRRITNARTGSEIPHLAVREEFHPKRNQARQKLATLPRTRFKDLSSDVFFELERRFPELRDEFRPEVSERERREEEEAAQKQRQRQNSILSARDEDVSSHTAHPSEGGNMSGPTNILDQGQSSDLAPQPSMHDVVVPAKSTLVEEEIAMPFTTTDGPAEQVDSSSSFDQKHTRTSSGERPASIRDSIVTNEQENNRNTMYSQASSIGTGFFNGYAASRATESVASPNLAARSSQAEGFQSYEVEKLRSDYEFRIATLQQKVSGLESRNNDLERANSERADALQAELEAKRQSFHNKSQKYEREISEHRENRQKTESELHDTLKRLDELSERHRTLENERSTQPFNQGQMEEELTSLQRDYAEQEELVAELRGEVTNLMEELKQLSTRNDEILGDKENDQTIIRDLNNQVASYKRKYENVKTELRTLKATSQLYVQPPKTDEFMPPSETGAIADINLTAFQSSIDDLLSAARSKTPSSVLMAMKTVILAATLVTDDVSKFEQKKQEGTAEGRAEVSQAKTRISNSLNNLMTACRNHASSHGLSPVSLLDAAASHVSTAIVDVVKLVKVRKATKEEVDEFEITFTQNGTLPNGLKPLLGSSNLANGAFSSPTSDFRRRNVGSEVEERLLSTPGGSGDGNHTVGGGSGMSNRSFSPRLRQGGTPLGRYSPVSYRGDITRKNSSGEGSWKMNGTRSRNASISSSSSHHLPHNSSTFDKDTPAVPAINSDILRAAVPSTRSASFSSNATPRSPGSNGMANMPTGPNHGNKTNLGNGSSSVSSGLQASIDDELVGSRSFTTSSEQHEGSSKDIPHNGTPASTSIGTLSASATASPIPPPLPPSLDNSDDSNEAYWADLRNYIEVQTEAIVHCIQALLSSIREGAQGNQLHENLTQITTIVSSIIAISKDNIPRAAAAVAKQTAVDENMSDSKAATASADGERILRELSEHCERLIEMQTIGGQFDKSTKSNMASASYGVAKGLKALNGLLNIEA